MLLEELPRHRHRRDAPGRRRLLHLCRRRPLHERLDRPSAGACSTRPASRRRPGSISIRVEGAHHLRLSFAGSEEDCREAVRRLEGWLRRPDACAPTDLGCGRDPAVSDAQASDAIRLAHGEGVVWVSALRSAEDRLGLRPPAGALRASGSGGVSTTATGSGSGLGAAGSGSAASGSGAAPAAAPHRRRLGPRRRLEAQRLLRGSRTGRSIGSAAELPPSRDRQRSRSRGSPSGRDALPRAARARARGRGRRGAPRRRPAAVASLVAAGLAQARGAPLSGRPRRSSASSSLVLLVGFRRALGAASAVRRPRSLAAAAAAAPAAAAAVARRPRPSSSSPSRGRDVRSPSASASSSSSSISSSISARPRRRRSSAGAMASIWTPVAGALCSSSSAGSPRSIAKVVVPVSASSATTAIVHAEAGLELAQMGALLVEDVERRPPRACAR